LILSFFYDSVYERNDITDEHFLKTRKTIDYNADENLKFVPYEVAYEKHG